MQFGLKGQDSEKKGFVQYPQYPFLYQDFADTGVCILLLNSKNKLGLLFCSDYFASFRPYGYGGWDDCQKIWYDYLSWKNPGSGCGQTDAGDRCGLSCHPGEMHDGVRLVGAKWFGKLSTAVFYVVMILIVGLPMMGETTRTVLIFISTLFLAFSFINYIPVFFRLKNTGSDEKMEK